MCKFECIQRTCSISNEIRSNMRLLNSKTLNMERYYKERKKMLKRLKVECKKVDNEKIKCSYLECIGSLNVTLPFVTF